MAARLRSSSAILPFVRRRCDDLRRLGLARGATGARHLRSTCRGTEIFLTFVSKELQLMLLRRFKISLDNLRWKLKKAYETMRSQRYLKSCSALEN